jgi:hypothetical protein
MARRRMHASAVRNWLVCLALCCAAAGCDSDSFGDAPPDDAVSVVAPADGATVATFGFAIEVGADPEVDPLSVVALLNGVALPLTPVAGGFTAAVDPGPPLRDDNEIVVRGRTTTGADVEARSSFLYLPPKARVRRVAAPGDLITGPLAHGRVGDFLLENDVARFIVQDAPRRDLANVGTYGGNLIDAELRNRPGNDNFLEIQPMVNVETVINAQSAEIVNDGQDGTAAILRTCGPDDPLDFINPSSNIRELLRVDLPESVDDRDYDVEGCTEYVLEPGVADVLLITTIFNNQDEDLRLFVGDYIAAGGALDPWQVSAQGRNGIGEVLATPVTALGLVGFDDADGRDYAYVPVPGSGTAATSDVLSTSGVNVVLHGNSILQSIQGAPSSFLIPAGGSKSYARHFAIGDGSGSTAVDLVYDVLGSDTGTVRGCVTVGGAPAPGARIAVGRASGGLLRGLTTHFNADAQGCFSGSILPGEYGSAAWRRRTPFENSEPQPTTRSFTVAAGGEAVVDFALPAPARLEVTVTDAAGDPMPARITLVGFDPSPEPSLTTATPIGTASTWLFRDAGDDRLDFGIADFEYAGADGRAVFDVKPGEYHVVVSRGAEFSTFGERVVVASGETRAVDARIARVLDTRGFVSSDFHVHGIDSTDSRTGLEKRALQYAGEGIENIVMTEHNGRTDLNPTIVALGLEDDVFATIGEEITSWEYGHYNGYPFDLVPEHQTEGSVDWAGGAEAGRDFVAYGSYGLTPAEIAAQALADPGVRESTVLQANHINSYFGPLQIDTSLVPPRSFLSPEGKLDFRLDPATDNLFHPFPAMEMWNGHRRSHQQRFFGGDIGIWFNLLNQGIFTAGTGVTDSHGYYNLNAAGARTWTASTTDAPGAIDPDEVAEQVAAGRAVLGQGLFLEARLHATDGSGAMASFARDGSTTVTAPGGFDVEIRAQAPVWAPFDTIEIYANAATFPTRQSGDTNVAFGAEPTLVLQAGADFTLELVEVVPGLAGASRWEANVVVPFTAAEDTWVVVVARGTDGISAPMFPVATSDLRSSGNATVDQLTDGNLGESGVLAMGITNPLFADVDGVAGFRARNAPR